ncbi:hypothetical protein P3875_04880 [Myroides sp. JBRI-B21084]|uniref:hypothetical protein n=1 Tax=Myroides sp. JBRI-B21084 TaxID=3119977 RepID=UPI0026E18055|nr:hypothetical protein [Paenimyroides cloacae]WKW47398.1 hypothetical protein P3875_04880 [Paenimyroides cloacae]
MKITIVAFDLWGFNNHVAETLVNLGHDVTFIDSSKIFFKYKNKAQRVKNFFSKTFLNKNIKKDYRNKVIIATIKNLEKQDQILIINPDHFRKDILELLRTQTHKFIAYNYDSLARNPLPENYDVLFDDIFSFDWHDSQNNSFLKHLTNFIYIDKQKNTSPKYKAFTIISQSKSREILLNKIANYFDSVQIKNYKFIIYKPALSVLNSAIEITPEHIDLKTVSELTNDCEIVIDLLRPNQTGLSFRIFEAMALHKKIITNNKTIKEYDFYNPNNILVIEDDFTTIPETFLNTDYTDIPEEIYNKYTLKNWVQTVFFSTT